MNEQSRHRFSLWLSIAGICCPLGLGLLILLMRSHLITFHDDFTGMKGLSYFLLWAFALLPTGLLSAAVAVNLQRRSRLALTAVALNILPLALLIFNLI